MQTRSWGKSGSFGAAAGLAVVAAIAIAVVAADTAPQPETPAVGANAAAAVGAQASAAQHRAAAQAEASPVDRGRYLVAITGCNDCHTPFKLGPAGPEPDMTRMLSGHPQDAAVPPAPAGAGPWVMHGFATNTAFAGPWGVSYAMNLTPDPSAAFHAFTEETFVKTMRTGKHFGEARPIVPPMPWQAYAQMTDEDLKAVYAYLRSIPPVRNHVPDWQPPGK